MNTIIELGWEKEDEPYEYVNNMNFLNELSKHAWQIFYQGRQYQVDRFYVEDFRDELVVWGDCKFLGMDSYGVRGSEFGCCNCEDEKICKYAGSEFKNWDKSDPFSGDCGCHIDIKYKDLGKTVFFELQE